MNGTCATEYYLSFAGKNLEDIVKKLALLNVLRPVHAIKKAILRGFRLSFERMVSSLGRTEEGISKSGKRKVVVMSLDLHL